MRRMIEAFLCCTTVLSSGCTDLESAPELEPEAEPVAQGNLICGDRTVASARTPTGNRVVFCVHDDVELIAEGGQGERMAIDQGACALDTFLALTDASTPVPARMVEACATRLGVAPVIARPIIDAPVFTTFPDEDIALYDFGEYDLDYCGADGQSRFAEEMLYRSCPDYYVCAFWNRSELTPSHVQSISSVLGEQGNVAKSSLASCGGSTRFRGLRDRGAADATWRVLYDFDVPSNNSWFITMSYFTNNEDSHFQFRGDSYGAARHRYSGTFQDRK